MVAFCCLQNSSLSHWAAFTPPLRRVLLGACAWRGNCQMFQVVRASFPQDIVSHWEQCLCATHPGITGAHRVTQIIAIHMLNTWMDVHMDAGVNKWGNVSCCEGQQWRVSHTTAEWMQPSPPQWSNWQDPAPSLQKQGWEKARTRYTDSEQVEHPSKNPHFSFLFVLQPETTEIKHLCLQTIPSPSSKPYLTMSVKTNTLKPGLWNEWAY